MARKKTIRLRKLVDELESWRISILAGYGYHYRTIASRLYGGGRSGYNPTDGEVARVGRVARNNGVSPMDWRRGQSVESRRIISNVMNNRQVTRTPKLKVVSA